MTKDKLTIGALAKRVQLRPSALRYYEEQGLLPATDRTESGYRLYDATAEQTVRFIQRAQRLGFSLTDIRTMLHDLQDGALSDSAVLQIAEDRFATIQRNLTEILVLRHEMELFLRGIRHQADGQQSNGTASLFDRLVERVCLGAPGQLSAESVLDWLIERTQCVLGPLNEQQVLAPLRGQHIHVWQTEETYHILVVGHDASVRAALQELARLEATCHAHPAPGLEENDEGLLFSAHGENAFIFAQLFLALESEDSSTPR
jgi:MerR family copper efflux transcriptional regulator